MNNNDNDDNNENQSLFKYQNNKQYLQFQIMSYCLQIKN